MKVEFFRHNLGERELARVAETLKGPILSTGSTVAEFERMFSAYLGCGYAVGLTSCTAALHLALLALDIGPGDEVITTPLTFVATANAILHVGAKPVFVDVEPDTGNLNTGLVEAAITARTKAIMPVHLYGQMADMRVLRSIADKHRLVLIEDCAHCIEGIRDGVRPTQLSEAACFSFYATKNITCGEGGALTTNDSRMDERLRRLRLHGMSKGAADRHTKGWEHWDVEEIGWKYNMDNIQAAFLLAQMERLDPQLALRDAIWQRYEAAFSAMDEVDLLRTLPNSRSARHLFTILVESGKRDEILYDIQSRGVGVTVNYRPVHLLSAYVRRYSYQAGDFPVAESIGERTISLPFYPSLTNAEVDYVIECVTHATRKLSRR